ncbi:MAG: hypothetical protein ACTSO7_17695 [Candidatus Heimdallarchaeota archaeon]
MDKKTSLIITALLIITISLSQFTYVQAYVFRFPIAGSSPGYVSQIINNQHITFDYEDLPAIDTIQLDNKPSSSQLTLKLKGQPNLSSRYVYRIMIGWTDVISRSPVNQWPDPDWDGIIRPKTNVTICVAGGAKWSHVTNGSASAYYDSQGSLIFSEMQNNTVSIINNDTLVFPVTSSYLENPILTYNYLTYTHYNATVNSSMSVFYIDSDLVWEMFDLGPYHPEQTSGFSVFSSIFICVFVVIRKRK